MTANTNEAPPAALPGPSGQLTHNEELSAIVDAFQPGIVHAVGYGSGVFVQQQQQTAEQEQHPAVGSIGGGNDDGGSTTSSASPERRRTHQKQQPSSADDDEAAPMIDLILSVDDPLTFHAQNVTRHPRHYSFLCRRLGPSFITSVQTSQFGAGVYFNPLVESPVPPPMTNATHNGRRRRRIKYGVIQTSDLISDLTTWRWLYVAGRMQKPTVTVGGLEACDAVEEAQRTNARMALAAGLLLLGREDGGRSSSASSSGEYDGAHVYELSTLYHQIAGISYGGDPRMDVGGEDPNKVTKLVQSAGQLERFGNLYGDGLVALERLGLLDIGGRSSTVEINLWDNATRRELWGMLPERIRDAKNNGAEAVALAAASESSSSCDSGSDGPGVTATYLQDALADIVRPAARMQSLKGLLTAGLVRSARYAGAKFAKGALRNLPQVLQ